MTRQLCVLDVSWKKIDKEAYLDAWQQLVKEAIGCAFIGLDLEWTSMSKPCVEEKEEEGEEEEEEEEEKNTPGINRVTACVGRKRTPTVKSAHYVGPVAVVQLSTLSVTFVIKLCDVVRIAEGGNCSSPHGEAAGSPILNLVKDNLCALLADERITKVGVGVFGDQEKLQRDYTGFYISPCVDLIVLSHRLFFSHADVKRLRGLKDIAERFSGTILEKDPLVIRSDWGGNLGPLSPLQIQYAARDAEASFDTCLGILRESRVIESDETLQTACTLQESPNSVVSILQALAGVKRTSEKGRQKNCEENQNERNVWWCKGRSKPYYHNIFLYDADMNLVFTVDKSKAEWYVYKKGLAKVTEWRDGDNSDTSSSQKEIAAIQLVFSPDFSKYNDAHIRRNLDYFRQPKENQCVVCGNSNDLVRFAVVPLGYRKFLPSVYMSHNSYDLLLLCTTCFAVVRIKYDKERQRVAEDYGVPLGHLTPKEVKKHRAILQKNNQEEKETNISIINSDDNKVLADEGREGISSSQKRCIMEAYLDIEEHRETLLNIFKYAKALRGCYDTSTDEKEEGEKKGTTENNDTSISLMQKRSAKIPPSRVEQLASYIRLHAPLYPFTKNTKEQEELFLIDAASPESVKYILESGKSPRAVLTRFWLRQHPEVRDMFCNTTRKGASLEDNLSLESQEDEGMKEENLSVDCHGFLVVQAVLQKYMGHPDKTQDHAVGEFIYRWRMSFVRGMNPKYLPSGWCPEDGILL
ncbi:uncharacterized protein TM35_000441650 [Trypanosoma theileri]|uniref:3'-5' exonuclease n=1 Tax=Trypanosoma theileri TaxID=67003 RepID=A0A1X0NK05_9TRYP|nr:uncharacterized protein TM35_000441650 [Trypanosoma theileri]ORC84509.1 hypothetical protein TM35_000441650 [Trypanosoma theileri]